MTTSQKSSKSLSRSGCGPFSPLTVCEMKSPVSASKIRVKTTLPASRVSNRPCVILSCSGRPLKVCTNVTVPSPLSIGWSFEVKCCPVCRVIDLPVAADVNVWVSSKLSMSRSRAGKALKSSTPRTTLVPSIPQKLSGKESVKFSCSWNTRSLPAPAAGTAITASPAEITATSQCLLMPAPLRREAAVGASSRQCLPSRRQMSTMSGDEFSAVPWSYLQTATSKEAHSVQGGDTAQHPPGRPRLRDRRRHRPGDRLLRRHARLREGRRHADGAARDAVGRGVRQRHPDDHRAGPSARG